MKKIIYTAIGLLLTVFFLGGCSKAAKQEADSQEGYRLFYISADETELVSESYEPQSESPQSQLQELLSFLKEEESESGNLPLLPVGVEVLTHQISKGTLTLDFNEAYLSMESPREVLTRAGVVRLFVQLPDIKYVKFTVEGQDLQDSQGKPVSIMNADTFVEYSGKNMHSYQSATVQLYFANKEGTYLFSEERTVHYNTNVPLEQVVLEELIKGPESMGLYDTLPDALPVLSVTVDGGCCYINFDEMFLTEALPISDARLTIYSIVNSISEACQTEKIQISVNGETDHTFREMVSLNQFFEKDMSFVQEVHAVQK